MLTEHVHNLATAEFYLPDYIGIIATLFFAITGALAGIKRDYDIIGVFVMAFITGLGGALMRDGLFIQDGPPALTRDWRFIAAVAIGCIIGWLMGKFIERYQKPLAIIDAIGMAAYSIVGSQIALKAGLSSPAAILVGIINACGAGLLRDIIVREEPLVLKPGQVYVIASGIGASTYVWCLHHTHIGSFYAGLLAIAVALILRLLAIHFNWHTHPVRTWKDPIDYLTQARQTSVVIPANTPIMMPVAMTVTTATTITAQTNPDGTTVTNPPTPGAPAPQPTVLLVSTPAAAPAEPQNPSAPADPNTPAPNPTPQPGQTVVIIPAAQPAPQQNPDTSKNPDAPQPPPAAPTIILIPTPQATPAQPPQPQTQPENTLPKN